MAKNVWNQGELDFIRANSHLMTDAEIAEAIRRTTGRIHTESAVRGRRKRLGIEKKRGRRPS